MATPNRNRILRTSLNNIAGRIEAIIDAEDLEGHQYEGLLWAASEISDVASSIEVPIQCSSLFCSNEVESEGDICDECADNSQNSPSQILGDVDVDQLVLELRQSIRQETQVMRNSYEFSNYRPGGDNPGRRHDT